MFQQAISSHHQAEHDENEKGRFAVAINS